MMTSRTFAAGRTFAAAAAVILLGSPAWADCAQEIAALDEAIVAAETGATAPDESMPATEHQEQVLADDDAAQGSDLPATEHQEQVLSGAEDAPHETAAGPTGDVEATSPHQRQAMRQVDDETRTQASELVDEARAMEQAGDEQGCMAKVTEARELLGTQ